MKHGVKGVARKLMAFLMTAMLLVSVVGMVPVYAKEAKPYIEDVQEFIKDLYENGSKPFKKGTKEPGNYYSTLNGKSNGKRKVTVRQNGKVRTYWNSSGSIQCLSFGKRAFDEIWYRYSSDAIQVQCKIKASKINDRIQWMKTNLQVGDYIRYCGHSAIVYDITDDYIELYDNNHGGDTKTYLWKQYWNCGKNKKSSDCVYHQLKNNSSESTLLYVRSEAVKDGIEHRPGPGSGSGSGSGSHSGSRS